MSDIWWERTQIQYQRVKGLERVFLCCSLLCIVCIKCMEPLSFDSPAKTDVVIRFPKSAKVRMSVEKMEEVEKFNRLGLMISTDGGMEEE